MSEQPGTPARHQRSTSGLIGSMIVTVAVVLVVGLLLRLDNGGAAQDPEPVAYAEVVTAAQQAGLAVAYPATVPRGWIATSVSFEPGPSPAWGLGFLTETGTFAGIRQQDADIKDLLRTYVDPEPVRGDDVTVDSALGQTWQTYTDSGGDRAYAALVQVGGRPETVLVYGSASTAELRTLLESLTLD